MSASWGILEAGRIPVEQSWHEYPTTIAKETFDEIWMRVRGKCELDTLASNIASLAFVGSKHKIRSAELKFYLQSFHRLALATVQDIFVERIQLTDRQRLVFPSSSETLLTRGEFFEFMLQTQYLDDDPFGTLENFCDFLSLRHKFTFHEAGQKNAKLLLIDFPGLYVNQLSRLLWPEWYSACFVGQCNNSSMWANYANGHKGVCLVFEATKGGEGSFLELNHIVARSSSNKKGTEEHWGYAAIGFHEVYYENRPEEVDFFRSLGRPSMGALEKAWFTDEHGNFSDCASQFFEDVERWQKAYWDKFYRDICFKTKDWEYEQEYRLILNPSLEDSYADHQRTLTYNFTSLKGIVFGIQTSDDHKWRIIDIIKRKCKEAGRTDFHLYQAYYCPRTGDIQGHELPMNLITE